MILFMKVSDYIVDFLVSKGVTDVFGIPGGVVLDFLDSVGKRGKEITARLNYNEQASAFAACGYAQAARKLSVAYATRGPGITNMVTGITDAFCESLPIFFITAHSHKSVFKDIRVEEDQEFDTVGMLSSVSKYAVSINNIDDVRYEIEKSYYLAINDRPGPILIDFLVSVLRANINPELQRPFIPEENRNNEKLLYLKIINTIKQELNKAKRPVILIGDGIKQSCTSEYIKIISEKWGIPILSSRSAHDIISESNNYYGYIGSHGIRYSNFILSKCDLIISFGNRLMFKPSSKSFGVITNKAKIIRIDVDKNEFLREIPNTICFHTELKDIMPLLADEDIKWYDNDWLSICNEIKKSLFNFDTEYPVNIITEIIKNIDNNTIITSDVGNNEFLLSIGYNHSKKTNPVLYSKSFGALGNSVPKAIGAFYSTKKKILCFTGDQGLQMNIQELQFIEKEKLPITIIVLNNFSSGMIRDQQEKKFDSRFINTTLNDGYSVPDFDKIAKAFEISYYCYNIKSEINTLKNILDKNEPVIIDIKFDKENEVIPHLPVGNPMQDIVPEIDRELYKRLNEL